MFKLKKFDKFFELMEKDNLDAVMIAPSSDMAYFVDYYAHADERLNCLVILKNRDYFHISPMINYEEAKVKYSEETKFYIWADGDGFLDSVEKSFKEYDLVGKNIGANEAIRGIDVVDISKLMDISFKNAHTLLEEYRIIKDDDGVNSLIKAAEIADKVMIQIKDFIKPGIYEYEITDQLKKLYKENGGQGLSFSPIVASGPNSSMPHYSDSDRKIEIGDSIVVDCGCKYNNMCSDISRTYFVGKPSEYQKKIYEICKNATESAQSFVIEGVEAGEVDKIARDIIEEAGYGDNFLNRTGHGIGFSVHEAPYIKANSKVKLVNGMAFSIEPGIYIPGDFGMRVENIVVVIDGVGVPINKAPTAIEDVTINVE